MIIEDTNNAIFIHLDTGIKSCINMITGIAIYQNMMPTNRRVWTVNIDTLICFRFKNTNQITTDEEINIFRIGSLKLDGVIIQPGNGWNLYLIITDIVGGTVRIFQSVIRLFSNVDHNPMFVPILFSGTHPSVISIQNTWIIENSCVFGFNIMIFIHHDITVRVSFNPSCFIRMLIMTIGPNFYIITIGSLDLDMRVEISNTINIPSFKLTY